MARSRKKSRAKLTTVSNTTVSSVVSTDNLVVGKALSYNNNSWSYSYPTGFGTYPVNLAAISANQTLAWTGTAWAGATVDIQVTGLINNSLYSQNFQITGTNLSLVKSLVVGTNAINNAVITDTVITVPVKDLAAGVYPVYLVLAQETRLLPQSFPMQALTLTSNVASIYEGGTFTITLTASNVANNTVFPYTVSGTAGAADFNLAALSGFFTVVDGIATLPITVANDTLIEGTETINVTLDNIGLAVTVNILDSVFILTTSGVTSVNEGQSFQVTLQTQNVFDNTLVPYTISGVSPSDIGGVSLTGNFTVIGNTASLTVNVTADQLTEGTETFTLTLDGTTNSVSITITDTSLTPTYAFSTSNKFLDFGNSYTINVATTNLANGTILPYTISGVTSAEINNASLTGNVTINSNATSLAVTIPDATPVGASTKNMTVTIGSGGIAGSDVFPIFRPRIDSTVNPTGTVTLSWTYYTTPVGTPDTFDVYIDGALQGSPTTASISSITINSGADRTLLIRPKKSGTYTGADITKTVRFFAYTGGQQNWTVPSNRNFALVDVGGAQGGELGGEGGRTRTFITTTPGETLYVFVGGVGTDGTGSTGCVGDQPGRAGGYNGGGNGGANKAGCAGGFNQRMGSGGGGASDIRRGGTALANRFIVSGGGGGCGTNAGFVNSSCGGTAATVGQGAGYGSSPGSGGVNGQSGCGGGWPISSAGGAASTSAGGSAGTGDLTVGNVGSLGQGANGNFSGEGSNNPGRCSGGGGGYYGGGSGGINSNYGSGGSGGGGSGYLDPALSTLWSNFGTSTAGGITGNGKVLIIV